MNLPPQESFNHPKKGYVCDSWGDMFSSCDELVISAQKVQF